ncbi:falz-related bromodomain-containing protein [Anaeramoeba flamelloides]|uniref:Falz-related bromodomain-containing protein n=1 Tax=Anaeramoeba flamelloides TaxID=1746091 RepID=A0AAV7YZ91_9EUKA|nr:falz-related bromodomain-containing protein [Anaeramoeba flamelloides]
MTEQATFHQTRNPKHHHSSRNRRTHHNPKIPNQKLNINTRLRSREREKEKERIKEENKILVLENEFFKSLNETKQRIFKIRMNVIIQRICYKEFSEPFLYPVDPVQLNLPTYPQIIKMPMDLSKIEEKLENNRYDLPNQLIDDLNLMINNCILFNGEEHVFSQCGKELLKDFHRSFNKLKIKMNELMCKQCQWLLFHKKKYRSLIGKIEKKQKYLEYVPLKDEKKGNSLTEKNPKIENEKEIETEMEKEKEKEKEKDIEIRVGYPKENNFEQTIKQNEKSKEPQIIQNEFERKQRQKETNKILCNEYFNIKKMFSDKSKYQPKTKRIFNEIDFMNEKLQYILKKINSERKLNLPIYGKFCKNKFPYQLFPSFFPINLENKNVSFKKNKESNQSLQKKESLNHKNKQLKIEYEKTNSGSYFEEKFQNYYYSYNQPCKISNQKYINKKETQSELKVEENGNDNKQKQEQKLVKEMEIENTNTNTNTNFNEKSNENENENGKENGNGNGIDTNQENQKNDKEIKMEIEKNNIKESNKIINQNKKNGNIKDNKNWDFNDGDQRKRKTKFTYEEKKEIVNIINMLDIKNKLKIFRIIEKGLKRKNREKRKRERMQMEKELNQKNFKIKKRNLGIKIQRKLRNKNNEVIQKNKEKLQINKSSNNDRSKENDKIMKQNKNNKPNENEKITFHIDLLSKETISDLQNYIDTIENFDKIINRNNLNDSKSNKEYQPKWPTSVFKEQTNLSAPIESEQTPNGASSLKEEGTLKDDTWAKSFSLNKGNSTQGNETDQKNISFLLKHNKQLNGNDKNNIFINNDRNNNENNGSNNQNKNNQSNAQVSEPIKNNNDDVDETGNNDLINSGNIKAQGGNNNISNSRKVKNNLPNDLLWNGLISFGKTDNDDDEKQIDKDLWETFQSKKKEEDRKEIEKKQKIQEFILATKKKEELMLHNWKERQAQKEKEKEEQEKKLQQEIEKKKKLRELEREKARREREAQANKKSDDEADDLIQEDEDFGQFDVDDDNQDINWDSMEGKFNFNEDDDEDAERAGNESGSQDINDNSLNQYTGENESENANENEDGGGYEKEENGNENGNYNENENENENENQNENENENEKNTEFNYEYNDNNDRESGNDDVDDLEITFDNEEEVNIFGDNAEEDF